MGILTNDEDKVQSLLSKMEIEKMVSDLWDWCHPEVIAWYIRQADMQLRGMDARWVCSIKQRLDRARLDKTQG